MSKMLFNVALVCVLAFVAVLALSMWHEASAAPTAGNVATQPNHPANVDTFAVMSQPTISAKKIDQILCAAHSPACGTGQDLYHDGVKYGIDPVYALAFFHHESSYGLYGVARVTRGLGNIRCTSGYKCIDGYRAYSTWQEGYQDWYQLILYYATQWHKSAVSTIIPTYAPSSENDVQAYIEAVENDVREWRA